MLRRCGPSADWLRTVHCGLLRDSAIAKLWPRPIRPFFARRLRHHLSTRTASHPGDAPCMPTSRHGLTSSFAVRGDSVAGSKQVRRKACRRVGRVTDPGGIINRGLRSILADRPLAWIQPRLILMDAVRPIPPSRRRHAESRAAAVTSWRRRSKHRPCCQGCWHQP